MKDQIKYALYLICLGASIIVYAHNTFSTKDDARTIKDILKTVDQRIYDIHIKVHSE